MDTKYVIVGLLAGLVTVTAACDDGTISEEDARDFVDGWATQAEESLDKHVPAEDATTRFELTIREDAEADENDVSRTEPPYNVFIRDVYTDLGWELRLASDQGLTDRGESIWTVLQAADTHALDLENVEFDAIRGHLDRIDSLDQKVGELDSYSLSEREREAAVEWLTRQDRSAFELTPDNYDRLVEAVVDSEDGDELADHMDELERVYTKRADTVAGLEQLVARNAVRYARKMKHFRIRHVFVHPREDDYWSNPVIQDQNPHAERPDEAKGSYVAGQVWREAAKVADDMKEPVAILHRRMRETLRDLLTADDSADVLEDLEPDHPQYAALKKEYDRYRTIVGDGGWETVESAHIRRGSTHETVAKLKKRLRAEGYFPEENEIDNTYGEDLEKAVEAYQSTHQMRVTGEPHGVFWSSLNKEASYRMKQIALNLKRWRESDVRHSDPTYAMVNIPGFTVSLFHEQERKMHFEIVVGNDDLKVDEENNERSKPNHTPELSAYIDRVIYNPFWNVTDRIRNGELLPKVRHSLEETYKAKMRTMRKKVRGQTKAEALEETGKDSQYFVAANADGSSDGDSEESSDSDLSVGPLAGPGSEEDDGDADVDDESGEETDEEPSVDIDDLFRTVNDSNDADNVSNKTIFNVGEVRKLVEKSREADAEESEVDPTGSGLFGTGGESSGESDDSGESGDDKSLVEQEFPYLDPETGEVDPTTTDPDNVPNWYEENDYEVKFPGKKWEYIRQTQGDHNALGRAKVIFPNQHAVYLHDTPKKNLFSRNIRAFSHGCMRMKKPLEFAQTLLELDGSFDDVNVPRLLKGKEEPVLDDDGEPTGETEIKYTYKPVFLDKKVPVHVEYFTVLTDEDGRANFYADIYNKDKRQLVPDYEPEVDESG